VYLHKRHLLEAARYPRFTMLGQSLGSVVVAWEALTAYTPDIFVDTTGYAFTFLVAKACARARVAAYVHYPTITADMLRRVHERRPTYNNDAAVANSDAATLAKVV
jgi:alpha-1,2-mannosyltransferase